MVSAEEGGEVGDEGHGRAQQTRNTDDQALEGKCMLLFLPMETVRLGSHARVPLPRLRKRQPASPFATSSPAWTHPYTSSDIPHNPKNPHILPAGTRCSVSKSNHGCPSIALQETRGKTLKLLINGVSSIFSDAVISL